ncbi:hypothetical protein BDY19DRAFT_865048, partial [Irpex rosettiformis]
DCVLLSTFHHRCDYICRRDNHVAKFMVCYDGSWTIIKVHPETSMYTLHLPQSNSCTYFMFYSSLLCPFLQNDLQQFPTRAHEQLGPIATPDGPEHVVKCIIDHCCVGRRYKFLIRWRDFDSSQDEWNEVLDLD